MALLDACPSLQAPLSVVASEAKQSRPKPNEAPVLDRFVAALLATTVRGGQELNFRGDTQALRRRVLPRLFEW